MTMATTELTEKRQQVLAKMESLQAEVQKVMQVLEKPEVIATLRQDKAQSLQTLKEEYNVIISSTLPTRTFFPFVSVCLLTPCVTVVHRREHQHPLRVWPIRIRLRQLRWCGRHAVPFPRPVDKRGALLLCTVGQVRGRDSDG